MVITVLSAGLSIKTEGPKSAKIETTRTSNNRSEKNC
jgi:hypothetical protein